MPITQQFLAVPFGSGHDEQSAFVLHELGQPPPPVLLPLPPLLEELLPPPPGCTPDELLDEAFGSTPAPPPDEDPLVAGALFAPSEPPESSGG